MVNAPAVLSTPDTLLYRIGRAPDPLTPPPPRSVGTGRFDDIHVPPAYRVLYAGERVVCFYECLAPFRVDLNGVAAQGITREWLTSRRIGSFKLHDPEHGARWLDLMAPETLFFIRTNFSGLLQELGYTDFDIGIAMARDRALTQHIGSWAHAEGYSGIRYRTRHAPELSCWAIFENALIEVHDTGSPISQHDQDLITVARTWNLPLPPIAMNRASRF